MARAQLEENRMRKRIAFTLFALPLAFALPLLAIGVLAPPLNFTAVVNGDVIETDWDDVLNAAKYSVDVIAIYDFDTDADGVADLSMDFDFGTSDRTDGLPISTSSLDIPIEDLMADVNGDTVLDSPISAVLRVKALNPGKGKGRQDNPFSAPVTLSLP